MKHKLYLSLGILAGIVVLAAVFRLHNINTEPGGLTLPVAAVVQQAMHIAESSWNGALYPLLLFVVIPFFDNGSGAVGFLSAVLGLSTVAAMFFAVRPWFGRLSGLLAAFLLATNNWHVTLSRSGAAETLPLFLLTLFTAFAGAMIVSHRKKKLAWSYWWSGLAGIALALGFYTGFSFLTVVLALTIVAILLLLAALHSQVKLTHFELYRRQLAIAAVAAAVISVPWLVMVVQRPPALSLASWADSNNNFHNLVFALFSFGREVPWSSGVTGFPLVSPLVAVLSLLGIVGSIHALVLLARHMIAGRSLHLSLIYPYLLTLLLTSVVLAIIATDKLLEPMIIMPLFILAGVAASAAIYWLRLSTSVAPLRASATGLIIGLLLLNSGYDFTLNFVLARTDSRADTTYNVDLTQVVSLINTWQAGQAANIIVVVPDHLVPVLAGQISEQITWRHVQPEASYAVVLEEADLIIFTRLALLAADRFVQQNPAAKVVASRSSQFGAEILRVYQVQPESTVEGMQDRPLDEPEQVHSGLDA